MFFAALNPDGFCVFLEDKKYGLVRLSSVGMPLCSLSAFFLLFT